MKKLEWLKMLAGSMLIYVIVAGCGAQARVAVEEMLDAAADLLDAGTSLVVAQIDSGASESPSPNETTAETPRVPDASTPGPSFTDPVPPASAQEPAPCQCEPLPAPVVEQPEIVKVPCDKEYDYNETLGAMRYAEAEFPGRTKEELARAVFFADVPPGPLPPGYTARPATVSAVRDGAIVVECGFVYLEDTGGVLTREVTIILPD